MKVTKHRILHGVISDEYGKRGTHLTRMVCLPIPLPISHSKMRACRNSFLCNCIRR